MSFVPHLKGVLYFSISQNNDNFPNLEGPWTLSPKGCDSPDIASPTDIVVYLTTKKASSRNMFILSVDVYIYRISHGLWLDMIFLQGVVCFISLSIVEGIEKTQLVGQMSYPTTNRRKFLFITCYNTFFILI